MELVVDPVVEPEGSDPDAGGCRAAGRRAERRPVAAADNEAGAPTPRIPIAERAEPHKIAMGGDTGLKQSRG
ncbi:hypothetical protein [Streptomyces platensis]|uniref:hypothetical protein n=1 Tax=Streptomyces platensis TaxID=58346 RepID=UPI0036952768